MLLSDQCPEHQMLPREYDLEVLEPNVNNHFIFSEEDLPGYKAQNKARHEAVNAGIPNSLLRKPNNNGGSDRPSYDRRSRYQPYYRKAVPSEPRRSKSSNHKTDSWQNAQRFSARFTMMFVSSLVT